MRILERQAQPHENPYDGKHLGQSCVKNQVLTNKIHMSQNYA